MTGDTGDLFTRIRADLDVDGDTLAVLRRRELDARADLTIAIVSTSPGSAARARARSALSAVRRALYQCECVESMSRADRFTRCPEVVFSLAADDDARACYSEEVTRGR